MVLDENDKAPDRERVKEIIKESNYEAALAVLKQEDLHYFTV
jgi:hypothetical protein